MRACTTAAVLAALLATGGHAAEQPGQTLIRDARVWDGRADRAGPVTDVLIDGHLVRAVGQVPVPDESVTVIDAGGRFLMPGIIDAHTHLALPLSIDDSVREDPGYVSALSAAAARIYLDRGWTTVRDMGGPTEGLARAIDEGAIVGPRIYTAAAFVSQTSGHGDFRDRNDPHPAMSGSGDPFLERYSLIADGPDEVRRATREALKRGATAVKLMAGGGVSSPYDPIDTQQYSLEELEAAVAAAADWGTYVAVHAYTDDSVERALDAGVRVIEHGHLLSEAVLRRIRAEDAYLSSQSFGGARALELPPESETAKKAALVLAGVDTLMETSRDIGLPVAFGTDAFGSLRAFDNARYELGYRLRWFEPVDILRQATSGNAKLLRLTGPRNPYPDGTLGVIEPGAYADLLIVDGDPLTDIRVLEDHERNIRLIMKNGRIHKNTLGSPAD